MSNVRTFDQLTTNEQDIAMEKLYNNVLNEALNRRMLPLNDPKAYQDALRATEPGGKVTDRLMLWAYDIAGALAEDAIFIPDDGAMVVRI